MNKMMHLKFNFQVEALGRDVYGVTLNSPSYICKNAQAAAVPAAKAPSSHMFYYSSNTQQNTQSHGLFVVLWTSYSVSYLKIFTSVKSLSNLAYSILLLLIFLRTRRLWLLDKISQAHGAWPQSLLSFIVAPSIEHIYP